LTIYATEDLHLNMDQVEDLHVHKLNSCRVREQYITSLINDVITAILLLIEQSFVGSFVVGPVVGYIAMLLVIRGALSNLYIACI
jgi:hypothetical protein